MSRVPDDIMKRECELIDMILPESRTISVDRKVAVVKDKFDIDAKY